MDDDRDSIEVGRMKETYEEGLSFSAFLEEVEENRDVWERVHQETRELPEGMKERAQRLPRPSRFLVLAEDWCMDSANTVPWIASLAGSVDGVEMRILRKEEHPGLMEDHLTDGNESIPVVMILDEHFRERGWWGPRPDGLRGFFDAELKDLTEEERFAGLRGWYARDGGRSVLGELLARARSVTSSMGAGSNGPPGSAKETTGMRERYAGAQTFREFLDSAEVNTHLWQEIFSRARIPDDVMGHALDLEADWHLLVLCEDWCGDGLNTVPHLARLAEEAPRIHLRILPRDENPELMDSHLTDGNRSIPVVMVLDEDFDEVAWWGPRPAPLQSLFLREIKALPKPDRYPRLRAWYARDRGRTTLREVMDRIPVRV